MDGSQDPRGERVPVAGNAVKEVPGGRKGYASVCSGKRIWYWN